MVLSASNVGFILYYSAGIGYQIDGSESLKQLVLAAADTLVSLYNPNVGCIETNPAGGAFGSPFPVAVDTLMTLDLLFIASNLTGN